MTSPAPDSDSPGARARQLGRPPLPRPPDRDLAREYADFLAWYATRQRLFNFKVLATETGLAHTTVKELFAGKARHLLATHLDRIYAACDRLLQSPRPSYVPRPPEPEPESAPNP